jgi:hypothetical protein
VKLTKEEGSSDEEAEDKESSDRELDAEESEDEESSDKDDPHHDAHEVVFDPDVHNMNYIHNGTNVPVPYDTDMSRMYLPMWQNAPIVSDRPAYNQDIVNVFELEQLEADNDDEYKILFSTEAIHTNLEWLSDFVRSGAKTAEPIGIIQYPIINNAVQATPEVDDENVTTSAVVGEVRLVFFWREHLSKIFADDEPEGLIAVFENDCNSSFTYEIVRYIYFLCLERNSYKFSCSIYTAHNMYRFKNKTHYRKEHKRHILVLATFMIQSTTI